MAHRTIIGRAGPDGRYTARWLQRGGHPDLLMTTLRRIWRDTFRYGSHQFAAALLEHDWSSLSANRDQDPRPGTHTVAGVGLAYERSGASPPRDGHIAEGDVAGGEWLYLIDADRDQVLVYEATVHGTWLRHSCHRFDPQPDGEVLGCGGRRDQGHRWSDARVRLPGYKPVFDAEVCVGHHYGDFTVARFTDEIAWEIAEHTEIGGAGNQRRPWRYYVDSDGTDFDLVWFDDVERGGAVRAARDRDGRILLGAYLLRWQVVDGSPAR